MDKVSRRLQYLGMVKHESWIPPALYFLSMNSHDVPKVREFLFLLERLSFIQMLAHVQTPMRERVAYKILAAIDNGNWEAKDGPLAVRDGDIRTAVNELKRPNFYTKQYKGELLLRTNAALEGDDKVILPFPVTIEHILPRRPSKKSSWVRVFAGKMDYHSRLGNLTLLTAKENGEAGREDFAVKRKVYADSKFKMSCELGKEKHWDAAQIDDRTQWIIDLLLEAWRLK